ncbi:uncharacterized protein LOC108263901 isoform X4 [Tachysurus ichikawai]
MSFLRSVVSQNSWFCSNTCFHSGHQQVANPIIPYVGPIISGGLKPGMALYIQGVVPDNANQFEINFQTGQSDSDDIAFHFNPHIGQYVYLNSFRNGIWEKEERVSEELFTKGAAFYMFVVIGSEGYEVYVNGLQHCRFEHRVPLENVSTISIYGDVIIPIYGLIDNWNRSFTFTDFLKITGMGSSVPSFLPVLSEISHPVILPTIPYVGTIRGGIKPDMAVFFQGTLPAHAKKFAINFQTGPSDSDSDIAFHFNARIGQYVNLNCFKNASWEQEETTPEKLLTKGAAFNMFIIISTEGYEVHMNGVQLCIFKHRIPLENISTLAIFGDISIVIYTFIDNWSRSPLCLDQSNVTGCRSLFSNHLSVPSEISHPVIQPALPYLGSIKEEIRPDMAVLFHGELSEHSKSFEINLLTGDSDYDDIAFHISPQNGRSVALNSFKNGSWETEEYASDNPFSNGAPFQMFFVIGSEGYEVYVNNLKHCTFKHRIPLEKVSTLGIRGDVTINYFGIVKNWSASSMVRKINEIQETLTISRMHISAEISHPTINPVLPCRGTIPESLKTDIAVVFQGILPADAKEFAINFQTGKNDGDDIAFNINPRIGDVVALNSFRNGSWETEEHASVTAFTKGEALNMSIAINSEGYEVYVNGLHHCTFNHRIPVENISTLGISGEVIIYYFGFVENWSRSSLALENKETTEMTGTSVTLLPITSDKLALSFVSTIPGGIKADMAILFCGTVLEDSNEFEINFQTSQSTDDIAFNINPQIVRFLVLSSLRKGSRETEDLASDKGAAFNMFVVVRLEGYEVFVNGLQYCMFKHRVPLEVISSLAVRGDVFVNFIGVIDNWSSSSMVMERSCWRPIPIPSEVLHPVSNPVLPYVGVIPGKAKPDMAVLFQGALPADANEFIINFQTGDSDGDDIAFCINPHLGRYVAINSFRNGSWETEESAADKPFTKGAAFNMFVIIKSEHYEVYVNGLELCTFKHRIPLEKISVLGISGDVSINFIGFIETWSKFSFIIENNEITGMRNSSWRCSSHQMISTSS